MAAGSALAARLAAAAGTGQTVHIVYHAGSQPGATREIRPIAITGEVLRAYDVVAGIEKHFRLSRIEIASEAQAAAPAYEVLTSSSGEEQPTILDFFTPRVASLEALGWHVVLLRDALHLHRHFKNGKPRKTPDVSVLRDDPPDDHGNAGPRTIRLTIGIRPNLDGFIATEEVEGPAPPPRRRAYAVTAVGLAATRRFGTLARAAALALEQARSLAPSRIEA